MKRKKIAVLTGGPGSEREISLITAKGVVDSLDGKKFNVTKIILPNRKLDIKSFNKLFEKKFEIVFIAIHGQLGEDGSIQGLLECINVPYTGPGVMASSVGMDKILFKQIVKEMGYKVPKGVVVEKSKNMDISVDFDGPYFVKPYNQGSSVGSSYVKSKKNLQPATRKAFKFSEKVMIEEFVKGKEVTVPVLGNEKPQALPVVEIIPLKGDFFDYQSKYTVGGAEEISPANISSKLTNDLQNISKNIYKNLKCKGFSRIDFILKNNKHPVVLEINTIPGLTPTSLFPKSAKAAGMSYSDLIEKIVKYGLK